MAGYSNTVYVAAESAIVLVIHNWETIPLYTQAIGDYVQQFLAAEVRSMCHNHLQVADLVLRPIS